MMNDPAIQDTPTPNAPPSRWRWWGWLLLAIVMYTPFIDTDPGQGNVASDLAAIESLVHRHTFFINGSPFEGTIDKFKRGDLYFSQKSPIFHLIAAVPYGALAKAGVTFTTQPAVCLRVLTFLMVILPMGWLLCLIFNHPWLRQLPNRERETLTILFAVGSLLTPFAITLNHYVLAAACLMAAVNRLTAEGLATRRAALATGWWAAASLACDVPPAFLFGAGLGVAALFKAPRMLAWLALGAAPLLLLYAGLNQHIIGSPLPPNLHEEKMLYYPGSFWSNLKTKYETEARPGYYQASYARRLLHATVGHKGTYWMMPLLALATAAALALARRRAPGWPLALAWAAFPLLAIALIMHWAWDLSGGAYNIRHILATIPPLYCVLAHPALPRPGRVARGVFGAAAVWGCLIAWLGMMNPWSHNVMSAWPPLENLARWSLKHAAIMPTHWIGGVITATSVTPEIGWLDLGETWLGLGDPAEAEWAFLAAIAAKPNEPLPYYHLGIAQDLQHRPLDAIQTYQRLLALEPKNLGGWNNLGIFSFKVGNLALARDAFRRSLTLAPGNATATWGELVIAEREGRPDPARLREALKRHPADRRFQAIAEAWGVTP